MDLFFLDDLDDLEQGAAVSHEDCWDYMGSYPTLKKQNKKMKEKKKTRL